MKDFTYIIGLGDGPPDTEVEAPKVVRILSMVLLGVGCRPAQTNGSVKIQGYSSVYLLDACCPSVIVILTNRSY